MLEIPEIDLDATKAKLTDETTLVLDIRDPHSYENGHIPGARRLHDGNATEICG
ncbi:MAG: thiosulfate sulfurtransferase, partial [Planctomycetes bacterium]|nr:thiosulfate sulfurtransferase [Planctomycetota bacterium]